GLGLGLVRRLDVHAHSAQGGLSLGDDLLPSIVEFDSERRRGKRPRLIRVCVTAGGSNEDEVRKKASSIIGKYVVCIASNGYGDLEGIFEIPCVLIESF
ncbi:hypothetical protein EBU02_04265, partial [bacterium]|nr:hypothetical protein [bacterium]